MAVGGGLFAHFTKLPASLAWDAFGEANGARSLAEMRARIEHYRRAPAQPHDDYTIGCILLEQPFFLPERLWVPAPPDWPRQTVQGKTYDLAAEPGRTLWRRVEEALHARGAELLIAGNILGALYGKDDLPSAGWRRRGRNGKRMRLKSLSRDFCFLLPSSRSLRGSARLVSEWLAS